MGLWVWGGWMFWVVWCVLRWFEGKLFYGFGVLVSRVFGCVVMGVLVISVFVLECFLMVYAGGGLSGCRVRILLVLLGWLRR